MFFKNKKVLITGASPDFGRTLAIYLAQQGAELFISTRKLESAKETKTIIQEFYPNALVHTFKCDLAKPEEINSFARNVNETTDKIDILINNGAKWLETSDFETASNEEIIATINSGATGAILVTKNFLPLLRRSQAPDIINMISKCGLQGYQGSGAHEAFYAMKQAQNGFSELLSFRLKNENIRIISLYPPDFNNIPFPSEDWEKAEKDSFNQRLNSKSIINTIEFALKQSRSCSISKIVFEDN